MYHEVQLISLKIVGLCIANVVQSRFDRNGSHFQGFEAHGDQPNIVKMTKVTNSSLLVRVERIHLHLIQKIEQLTLCAKEYRTSISTHDEMHNLVKYVCSLVFACFLDFSFDKVLEMAFLLVLLSTPKIAKVLTHLSQFNNFGKILFLQLWDWAF